MWVRQVQISRERALGPRPDASHAQLSGMEPVVGLEPTTDGLQNRCSTTELNWQYPGLFSLRFPRLASHKNGCSERYALIFGFLRAKPALLSGGMTTAFQTGATMLLRTP